MATDDTRGEYTHCASDSPCQEVCFSKCTWSRSYAILGFIIICFVLNLYVFTLKGLCLLEGNANVLREIKSSNKLKLFVCVLVFQTGS